MKNTLLILFCMTLALSAIHAQTPRMVLAEECTSSTCGPCGQQNPAFDALLQANAGIITSIKYHVWWPAPGNDPMYLANTTENAARTNYYGVNAVPDVMLDGNFFEGSPNQVTQSRINAAAAIPASFEIQVQHFLSANEDSIYVNLLIEATEEVSGNLVAQVAVIEKHIHFNSPPGNNGEKDFYNVMKKMLPSSSGTVLPPSMSPGDYVILQYAWELENVYDNNELAAVAFVQNNGNKEIFQAANSSTDAMSPVYANDVQVTNITNVLETNCSGVVSPVVTIRNNGSNAVTSLQLDYSVNGIDTKTYNWTGNLGFLETANISLDQFDFVIEAENQLIVNGINPNGNQDEFANNNTFIAEFIQGPPLSDDVTLFLLLDTEPQETTWELINSSGEVIQNGGPYSSQGQQIIPLNITANDCYDFVIYDSGNNGMCCDNGVGYYAVVFNGNEVAFEGAAFGNKDQNQFTYDVVGVNEKPLASRLNIYPNPVSDKLNIDFTLTENQPVKVSVNDVIGKVIFHENYENLKAGQVQLSIDTQTFKSGLYFITIETGNEKSTSKITVK